MESNDREINKLIMREIGLEIGPENRITDQDTGLQIKLEGIDLVAPGCYDGPQTIEFDPYNNRKMMVQLFSYFADKQRNETGIGILGFYNGSNTNNNSLSCRLTNDRIIESKPYRKESLKYTDLIMKINNDGEEVDDLSKYDIIPTNKSIKRKSNKKG